MSRPEITLLLFLYMVQFYELFKLFSGLPGVMDSCGPHFRITVIAIITQKYADHLQIYFQILTFTQTLTQQPMLRY